MSNKSTLPAEYFENKYKQDIDPWQFRSSQYEKDKYAATMQTLTKPRYREALEVGCSIGVLTNLLSQRCEKLLAIDASATALAAAAEVNDSSVVFRIASLPGDFPGGSFDLIVLSEILYYFDKPDLETVSRLCLQHLSPGGEIVLCHWLGETDYPLTGIDASDIFSQAVTARRAERAIVHDEVYRLERYLFA